MKNYKADVQSRLYIDQVHKSCWWDDNTPLQAWTQSSYLTYTINQIIYIMCIFELKFAFKRTYKIYQKKMNNL